MEIEFSSRVENDSENNGGVGGIVRGNKGENGKARSSFYVASSPKKIGKSRRKNGQLMSGEAGSKQDYIQTVQSMVKPELEASSRRNLSPRRQKTQKKYRKPTKEDIQIDFGIAQELSVENQLKSILATVYSDNEPSRKNKELATIHSETESRKSDQDCKPSDNFLHRIQSHPDHQNISQDRLENTQTSSDNCGESIRVSEEDNISDQDFVLVHQGDIELKLKKLMAQHSTDSCLCWNDSLYSQFERQSSWASYHTHLLVDKERGVAKQQHKKREEKWVTVVLLFFATALLVVLFYIQNSQYQLKF